MNYSKKSTSRKQKALKSKKKMMKKKLGVVFLKTLLVLVIALGVAGVCGGIGIIKGVIENAPDITSASVIPRGYKSTVYDVEGNVTAELVAEGTNRTYVKIANIPKHVQEAFIAIEDERFYEHNGIDIRGIIRAGVRGLASGFKDMEGASTITQQLLKNNVFDFMSEETFLDKVERKIQEQYLAIQLEQIMTKDEILESYLNTINLGQNSLGVQAASNRYFGKSVSELTISEAAVLAAIAKTHRDLTRLPTRMPMRSAGNWCFRICMIRDIFQRANTRMLWQTMYTPGSQSIMKSRVQRVPSILILWTK